MTNAELHAEVARREALGHGYLVIAIHRKRQPRGRRIRVLPGVIGQMVGWEDGTCIVDVKLGDLRRYLDRHGQT